MKGLKETATAHIIVLKLEKYSSRKENISMLEQFGAKTQIYISLPFPSVYRKMRGFTLFSH